MEIREYDYNTIVEYSVFVKKFNKSNCMSTLNIQTFSKGKKIFLLIDERFFRKYKIIGYAIIYEDLHVLCFSNNISEKYGGDSNTIFISDFMIDYPYRNKGIGKYFAKYIIDEVYKKNITLQPDGDGNWFWEKYGFIPDNISKNLTLILKRDKKMEE